MIVSIPTRSRRTMLVAFAVWSFTAPAGTAQDEQPPDSFCWTAESLTPTDQGPLAQASIAGLAAASFDSRRKTSIDVTSQYAWRDLVGPCTIRVVFQPRRYPRGKTPLLSKWRMIDGGRTFELGTLADGRPYFDVSASGNWDAAARELLGAFRTRLGQTYCLAAVFEPGVRMTLYVNGHQCGTQTERVPRRLHANHTRVLLGAQPPGQRWADVALARASVDRRVLAGEEISKWAEALGLTDAPPMVDSPTREGRMDLSIVRRQVLEYCDSLQTPNGRHGAVRLRDLFDAPVTLYASCDVAWIHACMGQVLTESLTAEQRREWIDHINSFARPDGTYENPNHGELHRNGMVIGALSVLGGRQKFPLTLYDEFDELDEIEPWLEAIHWERQWGASHHFWGGMHCYSVSSRCSRAWRERVFDWLDANLDPETGCWRKGVPQAGHPIEVLGGAAHIWPVYQFHQRRFPYPERVIDSVLAMQKEDGSWLGFGNYMELDALYGLAFMRSLAADYRADDLAAAARRHGLLVQRHYRAYLASAPDTHGLLAVVGTLALLRELDPDHFQDDVPWSDIFSDRKFYATDRVECPLDAGDD